MNSSNCSLVISIMQSPLAVIVQSKQRGIQVCFTLIRCNFYPVLRKSYFAACNTVNPEERSNLIGYICFSKNQNSWHCFLNLYILLFDSLYLIIQCFAGHKIHLSFTKRGCAHEVALWLSGSKIIPWKRNALWPTIPFAEVIVFWVNLRLPLCP